MIVFCHCSRMLAECPFYDEPGTVVSPDGQLATNTRPLNNLILVVVEMLLVFHICIRLAMLGSPIIDLMASRIVENKIENETRDRRATYVG